MLFDLRMLVLSDVDNDKRVADLHLAILHKNVLGTILKAKFRLGFMNQQIRIEYAIKFSKAISLHADMT